MTNLDLSLHQVWAGILLWDAGYPYHTARVWAVKPLHSLSPSGFQTCVRSVVTQDLAWDDPTTVARFQLAMEAWRSNHGELCANNIAMLGWFATYAGEMVLDHTFRVTRYDDGTTIKNFVVDDSIYSPPDFKKGLWWGQTSDVQDGASPDLISATLPTRESQIIADLDALSADPRYAEGAQKIRRVVRLIRSVWSDEADSSNTPTD